MTVQDLGEYLQINLDSKVIECKKCGWVFCRADENPKRHAAVRRGPQTDAGPIRGEWYEKGRFELRQYYCPQCATLFETEVSLKELPISWSVLLKI